MRIGIELNGVLRNTIDKIIQVYEKTYLEVESDDSLKQYIKTENKEGEVEFEKEIETETPFEYGFSGPVTSLNLRDFFKFKDEDELYSFLYEEFPMQIFGHAGSVEYSSFNDLNNIYRKLRESNDFTIVSDEIGKSKPASLFFLSKFGSLLERVIFYSNSTIDSMWKDVDVLVTANPELLTNIPENKMVIKFNQEYNKQIDSKYSISEIKELESLLNILKI